ncbi:MAG: dTDP-4-dehydrorhamnose 3,5-epimerase [Candidatus Binatia bacterium]
MNVRETTLPGVLIVEPRVFADGRGFFMETWHQSRYQEYGIAGPFVQDNLSSSTRGTLRGLHFQYPHGQGKLVYVLDGAVFDVAVDIRVGSPTFGQSVGVILSSENKQQIYVPAGFAHGFCVTSEVAVVMYKCTDFYTPKAEGGVLWNDPDLNIQWPVQMPILSEKDARSLPLREISRERLPRY